MSSTRKIIMLCLLAVLHPLVQPGGHAALAQSPPMKTKAVVERVNTIKSVAIKKDSDSLAIDVNTDGTCQFKQYEFQNPNRLVIDIYGAINRTRRSTIPVDHWAVHTVRVGQYKLKDPMITRLVLDLNEQPGLSRAFQVTSDNEWLRITFKGAHRSPSARADRGRAANKAVPVETNKRAVVEEIVLPPKSVADAFGARASAAQEDRTEPSSPAEPAGATNPASATAASSAEVKEPEAPRAEPVATPSPEPPTERVFRVTTLSPNSDPSGAQSTEPTIPAAALSAFTDPTHVPSLSATRMSGPQAVTYATPNPAPVAESRAIVETEKSLEATPQSSTTANVNLTGEASDSEVETASVARAPEEAAAPVPEAGKSEAASPPAATTREVTIKPATAEPTSTHQSGGRPSQPATAITDSQSAGPASERSARLTASDARTVHSSKGDAGAQPAISQKILAAEATVLAPVITTTGTTPDGAKKPSAKPAALASMTVAAPPSGLTPALTRAAMVLKPATEAAKVEPSPKAENSAAPATQAATEAPRYTGEPISLDFKDGDLVDFFRLLSQITGLNIVLDPSIKGSISIKMTNVPYDQVFDVVLENNGLEKKIEGNVVRVARKETLRREEEERRKLKEAQTLAADTVTETVRLNYANAEALSKILTKHLSPKGEIVVDPRTNTLIVKDIPEPMVSLKKLIYSIDSAQPQVEIEARIVSASRDFARDIGVQLGFIEGNLQRSTIGGPNTFGTIGGVRPSASPADTTWVGTNPLTGRGPGVKRDSGGDGPTGTVKSAGVGTGIGSNTDGNYLVNLAAQPPYRFSGIGYSLGNIFDRFLLDTSITAGESRGQAKLISQPKVTVQNNTRANITQGIRFPVQIVQNNTVTVQFFDAALRLQVTPQITDAGTIMLDLQVENNVADFSRLVGGVPSIRTSESKTKVLVGDGGTTVIAGILIDSENRLEQRAPGIASVPLIGNLFKRRLNDRNTQEILFFITPRIRKEGF